MRGALAVGLVAVILTAGCGQPPQQDVDATKAALEAARTKGAQEYAPEAMKAAEDSYADLQAEMDAQAGKFPLFRSYKAATEKAVAAKAAVDRAQASAQQAMDLAKTQSTTAIQEGKALLTDTMAMLEKAPKGKGSATDLAALKTDLDGAGMSLAQADTLLTTEKYKDALTKAEAAKTAITSVKTQIEEAMAKVKAPAKAPAKK
ncbi:MAG: hypothetical protein U0167_02690 [bacterium]